MFKLKQNNTTVRTELVAGITTFMAMAYILMVNAGLSLTQYRKLSRLQLHRASVFSLHFSGFRIPESLLTAIPHSLTCTRSTLSSATLHGQR